MSYAVCFELREINYVTCTAQKMKISIKHFFSKCDQIRNFLWIWSHLLKESFMENFFFFFFFAVLKEVLLIFQIATNVHEITFIWI